MGCLSSKPTEPQDFPKQVKASHPAEKQPQQTSQPAEPSSGRLERVSSPDLTPCRSDESCTENSICLTEEPGLEVLEKIRAEIKAGTLGKPTAAKDITPESSLRSVRSCVQPSSLSQRLSHLQAASKPFKLDDISKKIQTQDDSNLEIPQDFKLIDGATDPGIGRNGDNQDSYTTAVFRDRAGCITSLMAVFDGHGPNGGRISTMCANRLRQTYDAQLNMSMQLAFPQAAHMSMNHVGFGATPAAAGGLAADGMTADLRKENRNNLINRIFKDSEERLMHMVFLALEEELREECNATVSGTTATVCLLKPGVFWLATVGDSSAMLIRSDGSTSGVVSISPDHRLTNNSEKERVAAAGARVARRNGKGHMRIWLKELDTPGLMVTRTLGDLIGTSIGVTNEPEVEKFKLQADDRFLVLATDGVWDILDNEMIRDIVLNAESAEKASSTIVQTSLDGWVKKKHDLETRSGKQVRGMGDNITALVVDLAAWSPKSMVE